MGVGQELMEAFEKNENGKIPNLLARLNSQTANEANCTGMTPLHCACGKKNMEALAKLLSIRGINVNARTKTGPTPIMAAAAWRSVDALKVMVENPGVDLDFRRTDGKVLEEIVGFKANNSTEKSTCLEIIKEARRKRERASNRSGFSEPGKSVEEVRANVVQQYIEQIDTVNQEIEEKEKGIRDDIEIKNVKRKSLEEKQNSERNILAMKINKEKAKLEELMRETGEMNTKHENEKTMLENKLKKEDEDNNQHLASLKDKTNQLARDLRKLDLDPANDTTSANIEAARDLDPVNNTTSAKLEAARDTLECPVCLEIMRPPTRIWMCSSSHLICEACRDRLGGLLCPTCRTEAVNWRALMAEKFARTLFNN